MLYAKEDNFRDNHWHWGWWYGCPVYCQLQYIPRNMHTVFALLCFVVVIHWLIFPYPSGLLHWHCGNLTIAPVPAKQPWWIWINTSCEFIMNDCITTTKQSTTKPCAYFLGYTVNPNHNTDITMSIVASEIITSNLSVWSTICLGWHQRKHPSQCYWPFVRGIHQWLVDSSHKGPVSVSMPWCHYVMLAKSPTKSMMEPQQSNAKQSHANLSGTVLRQLIKSQEAWGFNGALLKGNRFRGVP